MAIGALHRCFLACGNLLLVAIDAKPGSGCRVVERSLKFRLHWRHCRFRMAIGARLRRRLRRLFGLRCMMTRRAGARMLAMQEFHPAHRSTLQDDRISWSLRLCESAGRHYQRNKNAENKNNYFMRVLHVPSMPEWTAFAANQDSPELYKTSIPKISDSACASDPSNTLASSTPTLIFLRKTSASSRNSET